MKKVIFILALMGILMFLVYNGIEHLRQQGKFQEQQTRFIDQQQTALDSQTRALDAMSKSVEALADANAAMAEANTDAMQINTDNARDQRQFLLTGVACMGMAILAGLVLIAKALKG